MAIEIETLGISFARDDRTVVISIRGEVDGVTAPQLQRALSDVIEGQGSLSVRLDLRDLTFIDSTGLALMARSLRQLRRKGGDITISNPRPSVHKVLDIVGYTKLFKVASPPPTSTGRHGKAATA